MPYICQQSLPYSPWINAITRKLPGTQPLKEDPYFFIDDVYNLQMEYRDKLLSENKDQVFFNGNESEAENIELLYFILAQLRSNTVYKFDGTIVTRPDGVTIETKNVNPLVTAARLVQEDLLILKENDGQHYLKSGVLCFPASWTLAEKKNKSLTSIHYPVPEYSDNLAPRIEKMFANLKPEIPIWRSNFLLYDDHELFQPRLEREEKGNNHKTMSSFMRVERQTLFKLDKTKAVVFAIHTFVVPYERLSSIQKETLTAHLVQSS